MMPDMWGPPSAAEISAAENENARLSKRVKELEASNADLEKGLRAAMELLEQRWISVEERLPEDGDDVAAIIRRNENVWEYGIAFRCNGKWLVNGEGIVTVTHWMPLPNAPKEATP